MPILNIKHHAIRRVKKDDFNTTDLTTVNTVVNTDGQNCSIALAVSNL
jgi:hypothetical protein